MIDFMGNGEKEECCDFVYFDKCSPRLFLETRKLCREFNEGHHLREIIRRLEITIIDVRTEISGASHSGIPKFWETNLQFVHSITLWHSSVTTGLIGSLNKSLAHKVQFHGFTFTTRLDEKIPYRKTYSVEVEPTCINTKHTVKLVDCYIDWNKIKETIEVLGKGTIHTLVIDDCSDITSVTELTKEGGGSGSIHSLHINHCKGLTTNTSQLTSINELRIERCKWVNHDDESRHKWNEDLITDGRCVRGIHRATTYQ